MRNRVIKQYEAREKKKILLNKTLSEFYFNVMPWYGTELLFEYFAKARQPRLDYKTQKKKIINLEQVLMRNPNNRKLIFILVPIRPNQNHHVIFIKIIPIKKKYLFKIIKQIK